MTSRPWYSVRRRSVDAPPPPAELAVLRGERFAEGQVAAVAARWIA